MKNAFEAVLPRGDGTQVVNIKGLNEILFPVHVDSRVLARIGFEPIGVYGVEKQYLRRDVPAICKALIKVLETAAKMG